MVLLGFTNASDYLIVGNTDKGFCMVVCPHFSGVYNRIARNFRGTYISWNQWPLKAFRCTMFVE